MLAAHPTSKITQENFEVFVDVWDTQIDELISLLRNVTEENHGGMYKTYVFNLFISKQSQLDTLK